MFNINLINKHKLFKQVFLKKKNKQVKKRFLK